MEVGGGVKIAENLKLRAGKGIRGGVMATRNKPSRKRRMMAAGRQNKTAHEVHDQFVARRARVNDRDYGGGVALKIQFLACPGMTPDLRGHDSGEKL